MSLKHLYRWTLGVLLVASIISGCGAPVSPPPEETPSPSPEPTTAPTTPEAGNVKVAASDVQRERDPNVTAESLATLTDGQAAFAFDLYQGIRQSEGNLFYSPYSISTALAMTYAGARGNTAEQMAEVLHYNLSQEELHAAMNALEQQLVTEDAGDEFTLSVANSVWAQEDYAFLDAYLDLLARHYGAGIRLVDFVDPTRREAAREAINQWVEEATNDRIEELITEGMLTELTRMVLANAIYFKADWEVPFHHGTNDAPFSLLDGSEVTVPMMSRRATTAYAEGEGYQAVGIDYKGGETQMIVMLPAEGTFTDFETRLDQELALDIVQSLSPNDVKLYLPKFSYDAELALKDTLVALGMTDAFDPAVADFSGMDGTQMLYISHVAHKAFVAVDEEGTEAAAATGVVVEVESMPLEVRVDRPFIFFIYDAESEVILFVGRVVNPVSPE